MVIVKRSFALVKLNDLTTAYCNKFYDYLIQFMFNGDHYTQKAHTIFSYNFYVVTVKTVKGTQQYTGCYVCFLLFLA